MFCKKCGAELSGGKFCPRCGSPIVEQPDMYGDGETTLLVAGMNNYQDEPTQLESQLDRTVAARDFYPQGAPAAGGYEQPFLNQPAAPLDKKAAKKAEKAAKKAAKPPKSAGKKFLSAVAIILAVIIVLGSTAAGVIAFTPKFKLLLAVQNTLFNTKSFDFNVELISDGYIDYSEMDSDASGYRDYYNEAIVAGAVKFGETTADTEFYFSYENNYDSEGYESYYSDDYSYDDDYNYNYFNSVYGACSGGEAIIGYLSGEDDLADEGEFFAGNIKTLAEYGEQNVDKIIKAFGADASAARTDIKETTSVDIETLISWAKTVISNEKINENVIEEAFNSVFCYVFSNEFKADMFEYKECKKYIADFLMNGLNEEAAQITATRIEDGMAKYDIVLDFYEIAVCLRQYIDENEEIRELLDDIDKDIYRSLKKVSRDDFDDEYRNFDFTLGTKGMRIVHLSKTVEEENDYREYSNDISVNLTNINKASDVNGYYNDIKAIADDWKDNYYYISSEQDIINYYNR